MLKYSLHKIINNTSQNKLNGKINGITKNNKKSSKINGITFCGGAHIQQSSLIYAVLAHFELKIY